MKKRVITYFASMIFILSPLLSLCQRFDTLGVLKLGKKEGIINNKGKVIVKPKYDMSQSLIDCDGYIWVRNKNKEGFIDRKGNVVIPLKFQWLSFFYNNLCRATINDKSGFINRKGEVVIPYTYGIWDIDRHKSNFVEGRILLQDSTFKYGYIDSSNTIVIPYEYEKAEEFLDGHAIVAKYNDESELQYGAIDYYNKVTIPFIYHSLSYEYDNLYSAYRFWKTPNDSGSIDFHNGMGVIDSDNKIIIPFEYDSIRLRIDFIYLKESCFEPLPPRTHLACFKFETGWSILDLKGRETTCCYEDMQKIVSGHVAAKKGAWGLIDTSGTVKIPFKYDYLEIKSDEIVTVKKDTKWAYWKTDGTQLSDFLYDSLSEYREGLAIVLKDKKYYLIDMNGKVFLDIPLDHENYPEHPVQGPNTLLFKKGKKYGLMDFKGNVLYPAKAERAILFEGVR